MSDPQKPILPEESLQLRDETVRSVPLSSDAPLLLEVDEGASITATPIVLEVDEDHTAVWEPNLPAPEGSRQISTTGSRFGDYELLRRIAGDEIGTIYQARQTSLNRLVALYLIHDECLPDAPAREDFLRAGKAAARLEHPSIVRTYEVGEIGGRYYLASAWVEGKTLAQRIQEGPLLSREAAEIVRSLAEALHLVHERGMRHGAMTPACVWLGSDGSVRLAHFGLSGLRARATNQQDTSCDSLGYLSPEQLGSKMQNGRAIDIYQLGAILYAALAGRAPFQASHPKDVARQIRSSSPLPPSRLNPRTARDLEAICLMCLRKQPKQRYPSMLELIADLRRWTARKPVRARPGGLLRRVVLRARRNPQTVALALIVLVVGLLPEIWFYAKRIHDERRAWATIDDPTSGEEQNRAAQRWFARASARQPADLELRAGFALTQYRTGKITEATATLKEIAPDPNESFRIGKRITTDDVRLLQALIAVRADRLKRAEDWWPLDSLREAPSSFSWKTQSLFEELQRRWTDPASQERWLASTRVSVRAAALRSLQLRTDPAVNAPFLIARLVDTDPEVRAAAARALDQIPPKWWSTDEAATAVAALGGQLDRSDQHSTMVKLLGRCGTRAAAFAPLLCNRLTNATGLNHDVLETLKVIDPNWPQLPEARASIASLIRLFPAFGWPNSVLESLLSAIDPAWAKSPEARLAIRDLVVARIRHPNLEILLKRIDLQWSTTPEAATAVPQLQRFLDAPETAWRFDAMKLLGDIGPPAREAVPLLLERLADTGMDPHTGRIPFAEQARRSLDLIDPGWRQTDHAREAADLLHCRLTLLTDAAGEVSGRILDALGEIGPPAARATPRILSLINDPQTRDHTRVRAVASLGRFGPNAKLSLIALRNLLETASPVVQSEVFVVLTTLEPGWPGTEWGPLAHTMLVCHAANPSAAQRLLALDALQRATGQDPAELTRLAVGALTDSSEAVRLKGIALYLALGERARSALVPLIESLADPSLSVRNATANALTKIEPAWPATLAARIASVRIATRLENQTSTDRAAAAEALGRLGTTADALIPALAERLVDSSEAVVRSVVAALAKIDHEWSKAASVRAKIAELVQGLINTEIDIRRRSAVVLDALERDWPTLPQARAVLPRLVDALDDKGRKLIAAEALARFGPAAVGALAKLRPMISAGQPPAERRAAALALGAIGPPAKPAIPEIVLCWIELDYGRPNSILLSALNDIDADWEKIPSVRALVPRLIPRLADTDWNVRASMTKVLDRLDHEWRLRDTSRSAVPVLTSQLENKDLAVREAATDALGSLGALANDAIPKLIARLTERSSSVRDKTLQALNKIDEMWETTPAARNVVAALIATLTDPDARLRKSTRDTLTRIDPQWRSSEPVQKFLHSLGSQLVDAKHPNRAGIVEAIADLGDAAIVIVPALARLLEEDAAASLRPEIIKVLTSLGPKAKEAVPALVAALTDIQPSNRKAAEAALKTIEPAWEGSEAARGAVPTILTRLAHPYQTGRRNQLTSEINQTALAVLVRIDPKWMKHPAAQQAIPRLIALLTESTVLQVIAAADALDRIDTGWASRPEATKMLGPLRDKLDSTDARVRAAAAHAVGRFGAAAADAIPTLEKLQKDTDKDVTVQATGALFRIRGGM